MHQSLNLPETKKPIAEQFPANYVIGDQPEVLRRIIEPDVNLCLWQRPVQQEICREISSLQASSLPDVRCNTTQSDFDHDVSTLLQQQGLDPLLFQHWCADLRRLADLYFSITEGRDITLRVETADDVHCPRFHVDRTQLRLLCTYQGPSTEWLTNTQTDRQAQSNGAPNDEIIRFGEPSQFGLFSVGIMKGDAFPGNSGSGLMHRSPSINASDQTRVLFCLDC